VYKDQQFLEEHFVQMNKIGYGTKNLKRELVSHSLMNHFPSLYSKGFSQPFLSTPSSPLFLNHSQAIALKKLIKQ